MVDLAELRIHPLVWKAINDYLNHNDKSTLVEAIRTTPEIFDSQLMRDFVADIVEGKKKRESRKFHKKDVAERAFKIFDRLCFYKGIGYPTKPDSYGGLNCCELVGSEFNLSTETIAEIYKKRKSYEVGVRIKAASFFAQDSEYKRGRAILAFNGGNRPDGKDELTRVIAAFDALPKDKQELHFDYDEDFFSL